MIQVVLPYHLRTLARVDGVVRLKLEGEPTMRTLLDALEVRFPALRGTIRDRGTLQRRPYVRFYACSEDLSHESQDSALPAAVIDGQEALMIVGAMSGG